MATLHGKAPHGDPTLCFMLPVVGDSGAQTLATAKVFGPFEAGSTIVIGSTQNFHVVCGVDNTVAATTSSPCYAAGMYHGVMPDGCSYVSMIDSADGAGRGQAYAG